MLKRVIVIGSGAAVVSAGYIVSSNDRRYKASQTISSTSRMGRLATCVALCATDYAAVIAENKWNKDAESNVANEIKKKKEILEQLASDQERETVLHLTATDPTMKAEAKKSMGQTRQKMDIVSGKIAFLSRQSPQGLFERCHLRCAQRVQEMCSRNGGVYIKIGQHLAMLDYILPEEYTRTLSTLLSQTPQTGWPDVQQVIREDLGADASVLFDSIDPVPIASASLAQVHVAYKNGKKLAVKVQHRGLREASRFDMMAITAAVDYLGYCFEAFSYKWIAREINANLPLELDFKNEVKNLRRAAKNMESMIARGDLVIPAVHDSLSSHRVLTMDFEEGAYISDVAAIGKMGLRSADVAKLVSTVFCEQIYVHGFVHCDPHPANVLVRRHRTTPAAAAASSSSSGKPCIVLLDHGLYKNLDDFYRLEYCRLWEAIILGDKVELKRACASLNLGPAYALFCSVLTLKPFEDIISEDRGRLQSKTSNADREMLKVYASKYYRDIVLLLGRADSELLLLLKTNDCLRHIDKLLGAPINTTHIVARITGDVLVTEELWPSKVVKRQRDNTQTSSNSSSSSSDKYDHGILYTSADNSMGTDDRPAGGLGFWLHARTQRALLRYCSLQLRKWGLGLLVWTGRAEGAEGAATKSPEE